MEIADKPQFSQLLAQSMASYGKPLPQDVATLRAWWDALAPFPLHIVGRAFQVYGMDEDRFPPVPAAIVKRCRLMDGRPTDEEAWAIALLSRDEADTVVWTQETAEAFGLCASVLDGGDEVGARMAFRDAYNRLVSDARLAGRPAKWTASLGWDTAKREAAVLKAAQAGLLPAPAARAMLPNYVDPVEDKPASPEGLAKVKELMAQLRAGGAAAEQRRAAQAQAQREAEIRRKEEIATKVSDYQRGGKA